MLLTQCLADREGTTLRLFALSISRQVLNWQRPNMFVKPFRLSYVFSTVVWFLQVWRKEKFAFLPKENQNFRLVQAPSTLPPQMACVLQPLLCGPGLGAYKYKHIAGPSIFILKQCLEVQRKFPLCWWKPLVSKDYHLQCHSK